jgi:hypothetical protein
MEEVRSVISAPKRAWRRFVEDVRGTQEVVMTVVYILITIMFGAILYYFTAGVGYDITATMTNATLQNKTYAFLGNLVNIGGSLLYFTVLIGLAVVFGVLLAAFRLGGGKSGV